MTRRAPISILALGLWASATTAMAQSAVQDIAPRHILSPDAEEVCELWRGDIHGNDPSAAISVRLCTREGHVTGTFSWSSRESGSDRRAIDGEWRDNGGLFVGRDVAMLEAHPLHGWTLCTADAYSLRRVSADRLEGTYTSARCRDHGELAMTRIAPPPSKPETAPRVVVAPPAAAARVAHVSFRTSAARCSAAPGVATTPGAWVFVLGAALACVSRRRRA
jgi:hypothetical protein